MGPQGIGEMPRPGLIALLAGLAVAVGAGLGAAERAPIPAPQTLVVPSSQPLMDVHVSGWVRSPGVVRLPEGSIVADAVEAAGGFKSGAVSHGINLAAPLRSGDQIFVSGPGAQAEDPAEDDGLIAINRASTSDLEKLPGVGPVLAERIVSYREKNGLFQEVEDLLDIPGIGESKLDSIRDLVRVP